MGLPVKLQDVVDEMYFQSEMITAYINRKTGELTIFTEEDESTLWSLEEGDPIDDLPQWEQETITKLREVHDSEDYIPLPSQFEIHEYKIMENFIYSLVDGPVKDELFRAIRGGGAFRMFKDTVFHHGLRDDWFQFKNEAFKKIAIEFLNAKGIPWVDPE